MSNDETPEQIHARMEHEHSNYSPSPSLRQLDAAAMRMLIAWAETDTCDREFLVWRDQGESWKCELHDPHYPTVAAEHQTFRHQAILDALLAMKETVEGGPLATSDAWEREMEQKPPRRGMSKSENYTEYRVVTVKPNGNREPGMWRRDSEAFEAVQRDARSSRVLAVLDRFEIEKRDVTYGPPVPVREEEA